MRSVFLIMTIVVTLSGCSVTDGFNESPMYLDISNIDFVSEDASVSASEHITDVWVYVDGASLGVYELPAKVPVLGNDEIEVTLFAGVRDSGQTFSAKQYPFYKRVESILEFLPGETVKMDFETSYEDGVKMPFNENFEGVPIFSFDLDGDADSSFGNSADTPYGSLCGNITVNSSTSSFLQTTATVFSTADFSTSEVYLELDHSNEVNFAIAVRGFRNNQALIQPVITLFPTDGWEKLYLNLSAIVNGGDIDAYQIVIAGVGNGESGNIWVDNIRLLHF